MCVFPDPRPQKRTHVLLPLWIHNAGRKNGGQCAFRARMFGTKRGTHQISQWNAVIGSYTKSANVNRSDGDFPAMLVNGFVYIYIFTLNELKHSFFKDLKVYTGIYQFNYIITSARCNKQLGLSFIRKISTLEVKLWKRK